MGCLRSLPLRPQYSRASGRRPAAATPRHGVLAGGRRARWSRSEASRIRHFDLPARGTSVAHTLRRRVPAGAMEDGDEGTNEAGDGGRDDGDRACAAPLDGASAAHASRHGPRRPRAGRRSGAGPGRPSATATTAAGARVPTKAARRTARRRDPRFWREDDFRDADRATSAGWGRAGTTTSRASARATGWAIAGRTRRRPTRAGAGSRGLGRAAVTRGVTTASDERRRGRRLAALTVATPDSGRRGSCGTATGLSYDVAFR